MKDERIVRLAHNLLDYCLQVEEGDYFVMTGPSYAKELIEEVIIYANSIGAHPLLQISDGYLSELILQGEDKKSIKYKNAIDTLKYSKVKGRISIREPYDNQFPINVEKVSMIGKINKELNDQIINEKRWVLLEWPNEIGAKRANMSYEQYYEFALNAMSLDYPMMGQKAKALKKLMERTDKVHIVGPGTDLTLSIKGAKAVICQGERNIPDGECYVGPVKDSINGKVTYNVASRYQGERFENISLEFKDGKIIKATSSNTKAMNQILDIDEGARYIGEFSLGFNPMLEDPAGNILFDEKIKGSFHLTPGNCYKKSPNGNHSSIHWDLVCSQLEKNGGGEIYFDDVLVRKDGMFVLEELKCLNPENLK